MAWFRKKSDPISERARALNDQIARLEAQIAELTAQTGVSPNYDFDTPANGHPSEPTPQSTTPEPTLRPTPHPDPEPIHTPAPTSPEQITHPKPTTTDQEPIQPVEPIEPVQPVHPLEPIHQDEPSPSSTEPDPTPAPKASSKDKNPFRATTPTPDPQPEPQPAAAPSRELGVRKSDFTTVWRRFKNNFRGPATSNPKLVNYLAAGSIQGLRPLRYEKRVARNRFLLLLLCLILVLWGIIAIVMNR